jgi:hypothetical protein
VPPFDDVQPAVEQEVRKLKALGLAVGAATQLAESWRAGADAEELAQEYGSNVIESPQHRRGAGLGTVGPVPAVDQAIFVASSGDVVGPVRIGDRGVVVAKVNELSLLDPSLVSQEGDAVRARLTSERAQQLLRSMINERRRNTVVVVNNELMERFAPRG